MQYLLAFDIGTSGTKATLFTEQGEIIKSSVMSYETAYLNDTWAEQDPYLWWEAVKNTSKQLMEGLKISDIAVVSLSGQMSGVSFIGESGEPIRKSIIWCDHRATEEVKEMERRVDMTRHFNAAGRAPNPERPSEKLMWIKKHQPDVYKKTYKVLQSKDYIAFRMTGRIVTDYSDASATYLFDRKKYIWNQELLDEAELDASKLPEAVASTQIIGKVTAQAAQETGLLEGIPVVIGAGDVAASAVGAKCTEQQNMHFCIGSSAWSSMVLSEPFHDYKRTYSVLHAVPGMFVNLCVIAAAGISYKWLKDEICLFEKHQAQTNGDNAYDYINEQIEGNTFGAHGVLFLPYLLGDVCIHHNPAATGAFIGLRTSTTHADILRSVVEGVCYYLSAAANIYLDAYEAKGNPILIGGANKGRIWSETLSNIMGRICSVTQYPEEATSVGAAVIGGIGVGLFSDFTAANQMIKVSEEIQPTMAHHAYYAKRALLFEALYQALEPYYNLI